MVIFIVYYVNEIEIKAKVEGLEKRKVKEKGHGKREVNVEG